MLIFEALVAALGVATASLFGAFIFRSDRHLEGKGHFVIPMAVGVFLSLVLLELIPETLLAEPRWGGVAVAFGFIGFYLLAQLLHRYYHELGDEDCDRKGAATLLLIGDGVHNFSDGIVLGGAFLVDPALGVAVALGLAVHEVPQEIVEFGVLLRAGYTKLQAIWRNFMSASSIVLGTLIVMLMADYGEAYLWLVTGIAAGNLLFLSASDLLPRIHGNLKNYGSIWYSSLTIMLGFMGMTTIIIWTHDTFGHKHLPEGGVAHTEELRF